MSGSRVVGTRVSMRTLEEIQRLVAVEDYLNVSDFLRDAVREKLEKCTSQGGNKRENTDKIKAYGEHADAVRQVIDDKWKLRTGGANERYA